MSGKSPRYNLNQAPDQQTSFRDQLVGLVKNLLDQSDSTVLAEGVKHLGYLVSPQKGKALEAIAELSEEELAELIKQARLKVANPEAKVEKINWRQKIDELLAEMVEDAFKSSDRPMDDSDVAKLIGKQINSHSVERGLEKLREGGFVQYKNIDTSLHLITEEGKRHQSSPDLSKVECYILARLSGGRPVKSVMLKAKIGDSKIASLIKALEAKGIICRSNFKMSGRSNRVVFYELSQQAA